MEYSISPNGEKFKLPDEEAYRAEYHRLENLTDGLEDWEMFIQLREKAKASGEKGIAHKLIQKLIRNKEDFTQDPKLLEATRREAAKMLIYINEKMKTQR